MAIDLATIVNDFAMALRAADALSPQAPVSRSGNQYRPGIGPHNESDTIRLVIMAAATLPGNVISGFRTSVPYPNSPSKRCDLFVDEPDSWAIECKMARFLGDNGKVAGTSVADFLSPYDVDRSALTDCSKLLESGFPSRAAILVFTYESREWNAEPLLQALETLAKERVLLSERQCARFEGLSHPVHQFGRVCAWEVMGTAKSE